MFPHNVYLKMSRNNSCKKPITSSNDAMNTRVIAILLKHHVKSASIFGSRARGTSLPDSDIDILVDLPEGSTLLDLVALKQELESSLGIPVDLLTYNSISWHLCDSITEDQVRLL